MSVFKRLYDILRAEFSQGREPDASPFQSSSQAKWDDTNRDNSSETASEPIDALRQQELQYYANLELPPDADFQDIKRAYRRLLAQYHPDRFHNDQRRPYAEQITRRLNEAYQYFERKEKRKS